MQIEITTEIAAEQRLVWNTISDVERWPEWTASVTSVERLDDGPLRVGSRARVKQPGFPPAEWTVTEVVDGTSFTWENRSPGLVSTGVHTALPVGDGRSRAVLSIRQVGPLGGLMKVLFGKRSRRYVQMEADGLKAHCERTLASS